jgi:regulatory protein
MDNPYYERLVNAAIRFISFRPRSEKELTDFLTKKMQKWEVVGDPLLAKVVERMRELGYVDDQVFALWWIGQRSAFRPKGRRALVAELRGKGVSSEGIEIAFSQATSEELDEYASARRLVEKKLDRWTNLPQIEQQKKVYTLLAQRGFPSSLIQRIIDELVRKRVQL